MMDQSVNHRNSYILIHKKIIPISEILIGGNDHGTILIQVSVISSYMHRLSTKRVVATLKDTETYMKQTFSSIQKTAVIILIFVLLGGCVAGTRSNHVRKSPLEMYSTQVIEAEKRNSPLIITGIRTSRPNSANGVDAYVDFLSVSTSPIKYATFVTVPYNSVQDRVASQIGRKIRARLQATGPYHLGATNSGKYWENTWYNPTIVCAAIESVEVTLMDGTTKTYAGSNLGDVFSNSYVNHCGNNSVKTALNTVKQETIVDPVAGKEQKSTTKITSINNLTIIPPLSSLPKNAGGISLIAPSIAENGNVVPVNINIENPLMPGDVLIISGDDEQALELRTETHPVTMVSTRLRLMNGNISAYVIRTSGQINSGSQYVQIGRAANAPPPNGNSSVEHKVRSKGNEVKMLFSNDMAVSGHIREVIITPTNGGVIRVTLTPRLSKNPYLGLKSTNNFNSVSIVAGL